MAVSQDAATLISHLADCSIPDDSIDAGSATVPDAVVARSAALFAAVEADDLVSLQQLIDQDRFSDVRDEKGRTPLMIAAVRGHRAVYHLLLTSGASLDTVDGEGVPAIVYVRSFGAMTHEHIRIMRASMLRSIALGFAKSQRAKKTGES